MSSVLARKCYSSLCAVEKEHYLDICILNNTSRFVYKLSIKLTWCERSVFVQGVAIHRKLPPHPKLNVAQY